MPILPSQPSPAPDQEAAVHDESTCPVCRLFGAPPEERAAYDLERAA